jgi:hypothetical protein
MQHSVDLCFSIPGFDDPALHSIQLDCAMHAASETQAADSYQSAVELNEGQWTLSSADSHRHRGGRARYHR